jgi:uncharacterized membrane protein YdjX (TVP38/TMEM64 family)
MHRAVWFFGFLGGTCPGVAAIWLFASAATQNGSQAGNILRVGFGVFLLLISAFAIGIAAIYLKSSEEQSHLHSDSYSPDR